MGGDGLTRASAEDDKGLSSSERGWVDGSVAEGATKSLADNLEGPPQLARGNMDREGLGAGVGMGEDEEPYATRGTRLCRRSHSPIMCLRRLQRQTSKGSPLVCSPHHRDTDLILRSPSPERAPPPRRPPPSTNTRPEIYPGEIHRVSSSFIASFITLFSECLEE